ncbi:Alpha/Beta hydrolase protein [Mycotypha africana]|uniref:Alpha/Beta hydrolase protein n=1 Tax=Mycotypha africana TaxID=64632 RepID=UPI002300ECD2|nr:Alpha/Beta hydrolase protein [Mycotypha africana]KAI8968514.1 Alpha/Beta hydrolase protein [Mycotypha africana]
MYLAPTKTLVIPVHPSTFGHDTQKLVVNIHEFPSSVNSSSSSSSKEKKKIAYIFSHSNGFHKEAFHPLMRQLIAYLRTLQEYNSTDITFISWDARNHGDSARLNDGTFLESYRWSDNAMDVKQIIDELGLNEKYDQFVGIGHSFGATSMLLCEFFYPNSFTGLCVIEPVLSSFMIPEKIRQQFPVLSSRKRRDEWLNREECKQNLLKKEFFKLLHPDVLELYVNYGIYDTEKGTVKLKCPREQEFHIFNVSQYESYIAHRSLQILKIPVHFVYALGSSFCSPEEAGTVVNENKKKITIDFVEGTHMVPNEAPDLIIPQIKKTIDRINDKPSHDVDDGSKSKL